MDCISCRVYGDGTIYGGCGGRILESGHFKSKVIMESDTEWREDGCHIYADLSKGGSDTLEGRVSGSVSYGFQGGKREV